MPPTAGTILVSGGAGYIGNHLVRALLGRGYAVRVLDKLIFTDKPLQDILPRIELVRGDIRTVDPAVLDGVSAVIHLAGFATEPTSQYNPRYTDLVNHIATERLATLAKARGIARFVFASSCSVYFSYDTPLNPPAYREQDTVNPISPYSLSKRAGEQALLELADETFLPTIFRKGTVYGLSPRMRYDLVVNSFVKDAFQKKKLTVNAGGQIWRPLIDIQDVVAAYLAALELPLNAVGGKIFNVASQNWNILDLAHEVRQVLAGRTREPVEIEVQPVGIARNYQADATRFYAAFRFQSARALRDAVLEIWDHLERHPGHADSPICYNDRWQIQLLEAGLI